MTSPPIPDGQGPPGPARASTWRWLGPALALVFVAASALFWRGDSIDVEALGFLQHYWGEGSVLQKVLDPRSVDYYRGRELSYAIDFVDAQWVGTLFRHDVFFFFAPSALLASLAFVALGAWLAPRALPALSTPVRWAGLLVLLSSFPFLSTMGIEYRSTKPTVAALLALLFLMALAELRAPRLSSRGAFGAVFATALAMTLLDRQGLFYVLLGAAALAVAWAGTRRGASLALGAWAAVPVWFVYNRWLGPWLIHAVNGYWPSLDYQRLRPAALLRPDLWREAAVILADWSSAVLGGLPPWLLAGLAVAAFGAWAWTSRREARIVGLVTVAVVLVALANLAMVVLMLERHPPVAWIPNRLWYYPLTCQVFLVLVLLALADRVAAVRGSLPAWAPFALAALVVSNVAHWPELERRLSAHPAFAEQWTRSRALARSLEAGFADPRLDAEYRRFFFDCLHRFPRLAARAPAQVGEGAGLEAVEVLHGRRVAWARRESQIVPRAREAGPHVLAGGVVLRPGDRLMILLGATHPRLLGTVEAGRADGQPVFFRVSAPLGKGPNDVRIVSRLPERRVRLESGPSPTGFTLLLPVAAWPEVDASLPSSPDETPASP